LDHQPAKEKLTIFLNHGDTVAEALLKLPGIADDLIEKFVTHATGALKWRDA